MARKKPVAPNAEQLPKMGTMVSYVLGFGPSIGIARPALVMAVLPNRNLHLNVFCTPMDLPAGDQLTRFAGNVPYDFTHQPNSWHHNA